MKPIEETHPSLNHSLFIKEELILSAKTKMCTLPLHDLQKHTVDKQVLKELIIRLEGELQDHKGATRFAGRLLKLLEELNEN